jgi:hypothetical protein
MLMALWAKGFCEDVCDLIFSCYMPHFHLSFLDEVTNLVVADINVLGLAMVCGCSVCKIQGCLIV